MICSAKHRLSFTTHIAISTARTTAAALCAAAVRSSAVHSSAAVHSGTTTSTLLLLLWVIVVGQSCAVILTRTAVFAARTTAAGDRWSVLRTLCFLARGAEPAARTTTAAICTAVRSAGAVHNSTRTVGCGLLHVLLCMLHVLLLLLYVVLLLYTAVRWSAEQTLCFITRTAASGTNSSTLLYTAVLLLPRAIDGRPSGRCVLLRVLLRLLHVQLLLQRLCAATVHSSATTVALTK